MPRSMPPSSRRHGPGLPPDAARQMTAVPGVRIGRPAAHPPHPRATARAPRPRPGQTPRSPAGDTAPASFAGRPRGMLRPVTPPASTVRGHHRTHASAGQLGIALSRLDASNPGLRQHVCHRPARPPERVILTRSCVVNPPTTRRADSAGRSVSESRRFLCHALYSAEPAACREISAQLRLRVDGASPAGMAVSRVVALRGPGGLAL